MLVYEFKARGSEEQFSRIREGIRVTQFIRNKCLRLWIDNKGTGTSVGMNEISAYTAVLAKEFGFAGKLGSQARQAAGERAWSSISRFYTEVRQAAAARAKGRVPKKIGYPRFQKDCRSIEYKVAGWKLSPDFKSIRFTDKLGIGELRLIGGRDLTPELYDRIKRVRLVRRADGYHIQFIMDVTATEFVPTTGNSLGLDVGLNHFYTDSEGHHVENPRLFKASAVKLRKLQKSVARKTPKNFKTMPRAEKAGLKNRAKAVKKLSRHYLRVACQRKDFVVKTARCVMKSNDFVAIEDLKVDRMTRSAKGTKSRPGKRVKQKSGMNRAMLDVSWRSFRTALQRYADRFSRTLVCVDPAYTSQACSGCGCLPDIPKTLKDRVHSCVHCGLTLDRDHNAAINILSRALGKAKTEGHPETQAQMGSDCGEPVSRRRNTRRKALGSSKESAVLKHRGVSN